MNPFNLQRFVDAQPLCGKTCGRNLTVEGSARTGCGSCPQLAALGRSGTATFYGISGADEARAYLEHPLLGPRLLDCCKLLIQVHAGSARDVFGDIDAMKLRSSLTLFETSGAHHSDLQGVPRSLLWR